MKRQRITRTRAPRRTLKLVRKSSQRSNQAPSGETQEAEATNIRAVVELERRSRQERTVLERFTDRVSAAASSTGFVLVHVAWFAIWVSLNTLSSYTFDPYPFNFLTLVVSLEAIILTSFVLMSEHRMSVLADRREHLDLQINMLAEEELTAILRLLCLVAKKSGIDVTASDPRISQLLHQTDVKVLSDELTRELAAEEKARP